MAITTNQFRIDFPEFADQVKYPSATITFWLNVAYKLIDAQRWGDLTDNGAELFAAHQMVLEGKAILEAALGMIPGTVKGAVTSQAVDKVSESYDVSGVMMEGAGHWNMSIYGLRYRNFVNMFGAGGIVV